MKIRLPLGLVSAVIVGCCVACAVMTAPARAAPDRPAPKTLAAGIRVTAQPQDQTVAVGQAVSFTAAASGNFAPTAQWQVSTERGATWSAIPGATSTTYSFTASAAEDGDRYRALFTNGDVSVASRAARLTVVTTDPTLKALLPSSIVSANDLRVASDVPYPPWEYCVGDGSRQLTGFDYDLAQALGAKIGIPTSFNEVSFDEVISSIRAGENDMIMSAMYDTVTRERAGVSFVDYAYDGTSILVRKGNPRHISNLASLAGKTAACESGTTQQVLLEKLKQRMRASGKPAVTVLALPNQPAALRAVKSGCAACDLTEHSTAVWVAKTFYGGGAFEVISDPAAPHGYQPALVGIGIVRANSGLISAVKKALQDLIDDGIYARIIRKYRLLPVTSAKVNQAGHRSRKAHAKDAAVKEGIHSIQIGVQSWAVDHHDKYPRASVVTAAQLAGAYVDNWPCNPWTHKPMHQGTHRGDYTYRRVRVADYKSFRLIGHLAHGKTFVVP